MTPTLPKEGTQARKILEALLKSSGAWVNGQYFCRTLWLTQFHAVIFNLENRYGWPVEHSDFTDEHGFKSYRIKEGTVPLVTL
jgi:hypothetical protein